MKCFILIYFEHKLKLELLFFFDVQTEMKTENILMGKWWHIVRPDFMVYE